MQDPLNFAGTDLKLELAGTNMELLLPLIGIAFPKTPSYQIKGDLDYADGKIHFRDFIGQLGSSDVQGNIEVDPGPEASSGDRRCHVPPGRSRRSRRLPRL